MKYLINQARLQLGHQLIYYSIQSIFSNHCWTCAIVNLFYVLQIITRNLISEKTIMDFLSLALNDKIVKKTSLYLCNGMVSLHIFSLIFNGSQREKLITLLAILMDHCEKRKFVLCKL